MTVAASILLLLTTRAQRVEVMGIAIVFAILAAGAMLLRGAVARVIAVGALVLMTIGAVAVWFGR